LCITGPTAVQVVTQDWWSVSYQLTEFSSYNVDTSLCLPQPTLSVETGCHVVATDFTLSQVIGETIEQWQKRLRARVKANVLKNPLTPTVAIWVVQL